MTAQEQTTAPLVSPSEDVRPDTACNECGSFSILTPAYYICRECAVLLLDLGLLPDELNEPIYSPE